MFICSYRYRGITVRRSPVIVIFRDVFTAGLGDLGGCGLTRSTDCTPWGSIEIIIGIYYLINSAAIILQRKKVF